jgi:DNA-nicking Smr family endonuclease
MSVLYRFECEDYIVSRLSEEEKSMLREAMQGVTPLTPQPTAPTVHQEDTQNLQRQTLKKLRQKNRAMELSVPEMEHCMEHETETLTAYASVLYHRKVMRLQDLSRLKKGEFPIDAQLDLHGLTEEVAEQTLFGFIERCYRGGRRSLLIIHGKGYHSETQAPILKNMTNRRLRQITRVLAFCTAQPRDGGSGSLYVLLKAR